MQCAYTFFQKNDLFLPLLFFSHPSTFLCLQDIIFRFLTLEMLVKIDASFNSFRVDVLIIIAGMVLWTCYSMNRKRSADGFLLLILRAITADFIF